MPIVSFVTQGQQNLVRGKGQCLHHVFQRKEGKEIAIMLKTPEKIREFQRKLYQKAKQEEKFRFYLLYDKVCRMVILTYAYKLVKTNNGSPGVDGVTFESIEMEDGGAEWYLKSISDELISKKYKPMAVKRVYIPKSDGSKRPLGIPTIKDRIVQMATKIVIEPIFEADFYDNSYGFRPKRNAHQAMDEISKQLRTGKTQIIDADISKYFDTIQHSKLLQLVAKRIVDKHILKLIKMWLNAPIVEENADGKSRNTSSKIGTPQGGVISPLLANIYLNVLDKAWNTKEIEKRFGAGLIRYADDFVVLCHGNTERVLQGAKRVLEHLELDLSEKKTRMVDARQEGFNFLGFTTKLIKNSKSGKMFPLMKPSKKSCKNIRMKIKELTVRKSFALPQEVVLNKLNEAVRGWTGYFYYQNCSEEFSALKNYLEERLRIYLRRKRGKGAKGYRIYPYQYLYETLRLYRIPTTAPWAQTVKATVRR